MPRISQLPSMVTADNSDELAIVDTSGSITQKISAKDLATSLPQKFDDSTIDGAKLDASSFPITNTVDSNGWTVKDYGLFKKYFKVVNVSTGSLSSLSANDNAGSTNAPSGIAPQNLLFSCDRYSGFSTSRYSIGLSNTDSTVAGTGLTISMRNITSATISDSGQVLIWAITR